MPSYENVAIYLDLEAVRPVNAFPQHTDYSVFLKSKTPLGEMKFTVTIPHSFGMDGSVREARQRVAALCRVLAQAAEE